MQSICNEWGCSKKIWWAKDGVQNIILLTTNDKCMNYRRFDSVSIDDSNKSSIYDTIRYEMLF